MPPTDDHLSLIKDALRATKAADKSLITHKKDTPQIRLDRIARKSDTGVWQLRRRTQRLLGHAPNGTPGQRTYDQRLLDAEDDVAQALIAEHEAWDAATRAVLERLTDHRERLEELDPKLPQATKRTNAALERLLREQPNFSRRKFFSDAELSRERPIKRSRAITAGTAELDASLLRSDDVKQEVIDAFRDEDALRARRDEIRQHRKNDLRECYQAAEGHILLTEMARAAGVSTSRSTQMVKPD